MTQTTATPTVHTFSAADGRFTACGVLLTADHSATYLHRQATCEDCAAPEGPRFAETPEAIESAAVRLFWRDIPGGNWKALLPAARDAYVTAARGIGF